MCAYPTYNVQTHYQKHTYFLFDLMGLTGGGRNQTLEPWIQGQWF